MRLLIWIVIGYALYRIIKGLKNNRKEQVEVTEQGTEVHCDPVCGVYVSGEDAVVGNLEGEKLYFCSMACLEKFRSQLTSNDNNKQSGGNG